MNQMLPKVEPSDLPIAVVGAGFSGTLLTINLIRQGVRVVLIERNQTQLAKGLAFGTRGPEHLLNVRAANMSAFPDDPANFLRWIGQTGEEQANRFVPRLTYGLYLRELLIKALSDAGPRAQIISAEALSARFGDGQVTVQLDDGSEIEARSLVLALGNFPPAPHPALAALPEDRCFADPWNPGAVADAQTLDHVLLIGTGLTAADMILSLDKAGFKGRITALSRRGLKPHAHAETGPAVENVPAPDARGSALVRQIRERAKVIGWRAAVDEQRPHTQNLWRRHDAAAQRRFLRHLRPYWDVHRHRLAPDVAKRLAELEAEGRLDFVAGKLAGSQATDRGVAVDYRPRGEDRLERLEVCRVINCTGPEGDLLRSGLPLVQDLLAQGRVRPDEHRLGLDVEHLGRVRDAEGKPQDTLFAVGPVTKGEAWEIVAVPDIRRQVWNLARYLADAHWVGGEGL
ncbi:putative NAD(P)/FAD-binding protein YdhS [Novosphingobium sp. PhB165]|uniref:FAD/NAD(P)-binding protein n=1 Tax=Novosphingobium sp. PhB165 TaxID=2485105 RepID=UPI0010454F67|nr:FAD/NAD(P)-binding protein [Novosphingobium sp. PhB165]TCM20460.1 putative NAD(P)/FAD-binding protein YdhS [Novosphingobium sp. PhB165]